MSQFDHDQSRRAFLKRTTQLGLAGVAAPFVTSLGAIGEAAAATAGDYKALVCVFMYGGNDYANTLPPYDQASYNAYQAQRSNIALDRSALAATLLNPTNALGGRQYAMAPAMASLLPVFNAGKMAVALNVGTLVQPTTKAQYSAASVPLPPKLFSHNDQQSYFQASNPEGATSGWGGRMGDLFQSGNGTATLTCINASGNAVYLAGKQAIQYVIAPAGPTALLNNATSLYGSTTAASTLRSLMTAPSPNLFANEHGKISTRALSLYTQVSGALVGAPAANFPLFAASNPLAQQLKIVAQLISVSQQLGAKRQVFFVSLGGFDMHENLATAHPAQIGPRRRCNEPILQHHRATRCRQPGDDLYCQRFWPDAAVEHQRRRPWLGLDALRDGRRGEGPENLWHAAGDRQWNRGRRRPRTAASVDLGRSIRLDAGELVWCVDR